MPWETMTAENFYGAEDASVARVGQNEKVAAPV